MFASNTAGTSEICLCHVRVRKEEFVFVQNFWSRGTESATLFPTIITLLYIIIFTIGNKILFVFRTTETTQIRFSVSTTYTQRIFLEILLNQTEIRLYSPCKYNLISVWFNNISKRFRCVYVLRWEEFFWSRGTERATLFPTPEKDFRFITNFPLFFHNRKQNFVCFQNNRKYRNTVLGVCSDFIFGLGVCWEEFVWRRGTEALHYSRPPCCIFGLTSKPVLAFKSWTCQKFHAFVQLYVYIYIYACMYIYIYIYAYIFLLTNGHTKLLPRDNIF